jgi:UDP-N-acetyl-D-galactosamine dehydrogenase
MEESPMSLPTLLQNLEQHKASIAIIGLGYVGLPLACLLAKKYKVVGFDINRTRIKELQAGMDRTREIEDQDYLLQSSLTYSADATVLRGCPFVIVTVPTPVDAYKRPDLTPLLKASETLGTYLQPGTLIVFESTVYPGCTEEECRKAIEEHSGLTYKKDFHLGYSPERINPGDKTHTIDKIMKVVSASSPEALEVVAKIYGSVIPAGIHRAPTIATAEAAKVIENTQRDLNIALINELAVLFERCELDTHEVLAAARTKWNFLDFMPGLVGGHCIGVDPYYLTHLAAKLDIHPQVILAGRKINDSMATFVADKTMKMLLRQTMPTQGPLTVGVLGVTFKENVPDLRNSKVFDVISALEAYGVEVHCVDPVCDPAECMEHYQRKIVAWETLPTCDAIIVAVKHRDFAQDLPLATLAQKFKKGRNVLIDLKGMYDRNTAAELGLQVWRL